MAFCSDTLCSNWSAFSRALSFSPFIACIFFLIASIVFVAILTGFAHVRDAQNTTKWYNWPPRSFRRASNDGPDAGSRSCRIPTPPVLLLLLLLLLLTQLQDTLVVIKRRRVWQFGWRNFHVAAAVVWNSLPARLRFASISRGQFTAGLKTHFFLQAYTWSCKNFSWRVYFTYLLTYGAYSILYTIKLIRAICYVPVLSLDQIDRHSYTGRCSVLWLRGGVATGDHAVVGLRFGLELVVLRLRPVGLVGQGRTMLPVTHTHTHWLPLAGQDRAW